MKCLTAILLGLTLISLIDAEAAVERANNGSISVDSHVKLDSSRPSYAGDVDEYDDDYDDDDENEEEDVVYDERQTDGETNIRLHIKNLQIQVPESALNTFQKSDMATMIQQSIFKLFGIPFQEEPAQPPQPTQQDLAEDQQEQQQQQTSSSMLQVNGNNLPAKFFLEISDFLMNNRDNDAVDDKRVETNHQQQQNAEIYATEEIKIERLENVNNVKNETITISKKRYSVAPQSSADPQNLTTFELTHNKFSNNVTTNNTEKEDRFQQTRPIRLDTVVMQVETDDNAGGRPKTLREKVIWRVDGEDGGDGANAGDGGDGSQLIRSPPVVKAN